jgi:cytochrome c556
MNKALAAALAATALLGGCKQAADTPELTLQQFMAQKVDPTSKIYFDAVGSVSELIDGKPVQRDIAPQTDADWEKVRQAAADLQEQGRELQSPGYTEGRNADWARFSQSLVEISEQAEQAAKDKNPDKVFEIGGTMYMVCDACHVAYPADSTQPGGGGAS